jgi:hypothetical protein
MHNTQPVHLSLSVSRELRRYAAIIGSDPDKMADELMLSTLATLRKLRYFEPKPETLDASGALAILDKAGLGNPPDAGDELPDDLLHLLNKHPR